MHQELQKQIEGERKNQVLLHIPSNHNSINFYFERQALNKCTSTVVSIKFQTGAAHS